MSTELRPKKLHLRHPVAAKPKTVNVLAMESVVGEPGADRTRDLLIKSQTLYH
jgi:hypothetical protein